jgi:carbamoyl-phosphate synthase large subunit
VITVLLYPLGVPATHGTVYMLRNNPDDAPVRIIGVDTNPDVAARNLVDTFHALPPGGTLEAICEQESVDVVLPQADFATTPSDKGEFLTLFRDLDLPCPDYQEATDVDTLAAALDALGYPSRPLIVKPALGWGRRGTYLITGTLDPDTLFTERRPLPTLTASQLLDAADQATNLPKLLVMEYLPGAEYTVDAFLGEHAAVAIPRIRRQILAGTAFETELDYRVDLTDWTLRAGRALHLTGIFGMQFRCDAAGLPKPLECNPRIQGTTIASLFSGINLVWMAVQEALGNPPPQPPQPSRPATFTRTWGGIAHGPNWLEQV